MTAAAMNPGPVEEVGKTTGLFMTIMKDQPLALSLCVMNVMLLGLFFYIFKTANESRTHAFELLQQAQRETQQLLYSCVPAVKNPTSGEYRLQSDESKPAELTPLPQPKPDEAKE